MAGSSTITRRMLSKLDRMQIKMIAAAVTGRMGHHVKKASSRSLSKPLKH